MNAACVVAFVACVNADKFSVMYLILLKSLVHRHGRGASFNTCRVYAPYVVAFVACENADKFFVYVPDFIEVSCALAWTRARLGTCLVEQQCVSCVHTLQHVSVFPFLGWAGACMRHAAWHTASVRRMWHGLCSRRHLCCMVLPKDVRTQIVQWCYTK